MADITVTREDKHFLVTCKGQTVTCSDIANVYEHIEHLTRFHPELTEEWLGDFQVEEDE